MTPLDFREVKKRLQYTINNFQVQLMNETRLYAINLPDHIEPSKKLVQEACKHLSKSFEDRWTLQSLALVLGTNRKKISQLFKEQMGMSVFEWLRARKMEHAQQQVRNSQQPFCVIALTVGFDNGANFSNAYRKKFGVSPFRDRKDTQEQEKVTLAHSEIEFYYNINNRGMRKNRYLLIMVLL